MRKKHQVTLERLFEQPARSDIKWSAIERLVEHLNGEISEGRGSRVRMHLNGIVAVFHRPHPNPEASKALVKDVCRFLSEAGVKP